VAVTLFGPYDRWMRTVLICHADAPLDSQGLARWLASISCLSGIVILDETKRRLWRRIRREVKRVGVLRFVDVLAFRLYYRLFLRERDRRWEERQLSELCARYSPLTAETQVLRARSPNTPEVEQFLRSLAPSIVIARCKTLLKSSVFTIPSRGTFVLHPGICPEYRNAHGCFWALARDDLAKVGMTLLRIDKGVDTGPVFGYFHYDYDESTDSHIIIQQKVVFENLDGLRKRLVEIHEGRAVPLDTAGRPSGEWGQPWLSAFWAWRRRAYRRKRHAAHASLP
jgi:hypothetical protein